MKTLTGILIVLLMVACHFVVTGAAIWQYIFFLLVVSLLVVLTIFIYWKNNKPLKITMPEIWLITFILYLLLNNSINDSFWGNERLFNTLILLLLYFAFAVLYANDKAVFTFVFYGLFAALTVELLIGFGQLFGIVSNADSKFMVEGLFGNPGAFAGYLAIVFPFLLTVLIFYKQFFISDNLRYAIVLYLFCTACLIILCDSRGAWMASLIGTGFLLNLRYELVSRICHSLKTKTLKLSVGMILLLTITLVSFILYHYKQQSAFGRFFIWKVSMSMATENPVTGSGFGSFEADYGKAQAGYFLNNKACKNEIRVADYVTCAYNEFLEMLIESGFVGLLLFGSILYFALTKHYKTSSSKYYIAAKTSLIALLVLSMVSYPFRIIPDFLLLIICLCIIFRTANYKTFTISKYGKTAILIWFIIFSGLIYCSGLQLYGFYHFRKGYRQIVNNDLEKGIGHYKKAYDFLDNNGNFLFYYGSALFLKQHFGQSAGLLQKAVALRSDPNAFIMLGNSLKKLKRYYESESAYQTAAAITPAKLYPKYLLVKLYMEMHKTDKALRMAKIILNTKEKVRTTAGTEIKTELKRLLNKHQNKR